MSGPNREVDHYAVLGVLPGAEGVVIIAAYRALASLYHPDRWKGVVSEATHRMAEINVAYGILGDEVKRKKYDASRSSTHANFAGNEDAQDTAFNEALGDLERDWQIAVEFYPDLLEIRGGLKRTSYQLAFAYVTLIISTKNFKERKTIAESMEAEFLSRYFGAQPRIISFAKYLINAGKRDAIKKLNRYVEVLGSEIDVDAIIHKINVDFDLKDSHLKSGLPYGITFVGGYYFFENEAYVRLVDAICYARLVVGKRST